MQCCHGLKHCDLELRSHSRSNRVGEKADTLTEKGQHFVLKRTQKGLRKQKDLRKKTASKKGVWAYYVTGVCMHMLHVYMHVSVSVSCCVSCMCEWER